MMPSMLRPYHVVWGAFIAALIAASIYYNRNPAAAEGGGGVFGIGFIALIVLLMNTRRKR